MNPEEEKPVEEASSMEREHMFDKVVTPSDVGKLNRLVIPKQHAERYFPLDNSSTNDNNKGLLLNFEDRTGNSWRFRYSYWNSSQSYVMTKGWSRFVKDKKLDAGDIVSFQRDPGNKDKLYIDWRRRPKIPDHHHQFAGAMFPRIYSFPHPQMPTNYESHNLYHRFQRDLGIGYYVRSMERSHPTAVIESVPVMMQRRSQVAAMASSRGEKRLRLFGVDMECGGGGGGGASVNSTEEESSSSGGSMPCGSVSMAGAGSLLQLRLVTSDDESLVAMEAASVDEDHNLFTKKGKSSLSFDLDR
ncbi:hypothetical protein EUTSA_v10006123mg [Eutrema salsugineum]|uniref:TF-B3 domain-containing protein n=1 Tax=Eutrema salsugineum TaxID=72664 RepID=V4LN25_EUTSA|nr:B3 domain-containing transcription factor NGA2 [Eutrema salsugineum]ESQ43877.1 hypothetical protein EUTSA_v10006123mg [Eutrema salsugineum]